MDLLLMDFEKASIPCLFSHSALRFRRRSKQASASSIQRYSPPLSIFFTFVLSSRSLHAPFMVYSWCVHGVFIPSQHPNHSFLSKFRHFFSAYRLAASSAMFCAWQASTTVTVSPSIVYAKYHLSFARACSRSTMLKYDLALFSLNRSLVGISHMVSRPTRDGRLSTEESLLNLVNREDCIMCIAFHIVLIVSVAVFLRHILIERKYLARCPGLDDIVHVSLMHR